MYFSTQLAAGDVGRKLIDNRVTCVLALRKGIGTKPNNEPAHLANRRICLSWVPIGSLAGRQYRKMACLLTGLSACICQEASESVLTVPSTLAETLLSTLQGEPLSARK